METLRRMITAAMKWTWTLLTIIFTREEKSYTHSKQMAKYSDKITWGYQPNTESQYALRNVERSNTGEVLDTIFYQTNHYMYFYYPTKLQPLK